MRWLLFLIFLLLSSLSRAEILTIAVIGDPQEGVRCEYTSAAWNHFKAMATWLAAQGPSKIDLAVIVGDLVNGPGFSEDYKDCWCASNSASPCTDLVHPWYGTGYCDEQCGNADATTCTDGTPGLTCEWDRIKLFADTIENSGIRTVVVNGNHDADDGIVGAGGSRRYEVYESYFPTSSITTNDIDESGYHFATVTDGAGIDFTAPASFYILFTAAGIQWRLVAFSWTHYKQIPESTVEWVHDLLNADPDIPTILLGHTMVGVCNNANYDYLWCRSAGSITWIGKTVYDDLLPSHKEIFLAIGGHDRHLYRGISDGQGYDVLGVAVDYTEVVGSDKGWQTGANGGGGVIQYIRIDPVDGVIWSTTYSPYEDEELKYYNTLPQGSDWVEQMPICRDDVRFDLPAAACPEREPSPQCCNQ